MDLSSGDTRQAFKQIEEVTKQFSNYMNCAYETTTRKTATTTTTTATKISPRTEPIPRTQLSSELKNYATHCYLLNNNHATIVISFIFSLAKNE